MREAAIRRTEALAARFFFALSLLPLSACLHHATDQDLVTEDHALLNDYRNLQAKYDRHGISPRKFSEGLSELHQREEVVFGRARRHHFTDMQASNYFFRSRMKFPSPISQAQKIMADRETTQ